MRCSICGNDLKLKNGMYICPNCGFIQNTYIDSNTDVFICCTEVNNQGNPTIDSMMAQNLHSGLKSQNINVFYPAKSLEGCPYSEYNERVEEAIESAKIIIITGTRKEHFKNMLNYYGDLFKSKAILPIYSSMSEYDIERIPEMFPAINYDAPGAFGKIINDVSGVLTLLDSREGKTTRTHEKTRKTNLMFIIIGIITFVLLVIITVFILFVTPNISSKNDYEKAQSYEESGQYVNAINLYDELGNYKDSVDLKNKLYSKYSKFYSDSDKMIEMDLDISNGTANIKINEYYGKKVISTKTQSKPEGSTIEFKYKDSAGVTGTGTIELFDDSVKLTIDSSATDAYCISTGRVIFPLDYTYEPLKITKNAKDESNFETYEDEFETETDEETKTKTKTETKPEPEKPQQQPMYYVRTSANNSTSQLGAYNDLNNAKNKANNNKSKGYKVFDKYGNLIYDPNPASTPKPDNVPNYYVRTSANDKTSQIGAFNDLNNAKNKANSNSGYKVYDKYGNLIYDPTPTPAPSNSPSYYVRTSAYDKTSQIGAYNDLNNAKNQANQYKSQGYKVFDINGNLIYAP